MAVARRRKLPLYLQVIIGVVLGAVFGVAFDKRLFLFGAGNEDLGEMGMLFIRLLKALAVPLVLFAILDAFMKTRLSARSGIRLLVICAVNASVAFVIGLTLMNVFRPGESSRVEFAKLLQGQPAAGSEVLSGESLSLFRAVQSYVPENLVDPFLKGNIIPVVLLALLVGAALRRLKDGPGPLVAEVETLESFIHGALRVLMLVLCWVIKAVPFAVFGIVAQVVGRSGLAVFAALAPFLCVVLAGFTLHALGYYPLAAWVVGRRSPFEFLGKGADAIVTGLSTNSSLATVPVTLQCLTQKLGVTDASARLSACIGTNLNNDGITLYEAMAALFVAQALGMDLTFGQQTVVVLASLMAGVGIAGIPEAGLVMLPLVLGAIGLPTHVVAIAMTFVMPVDWIIARCRSGVNVMSDMLVAIMLDGQNRRPEPQAVPAHDIEPMRSAPGGSRVG